MAAPLHKARILMANFISPTIRLFQLEALTANQPCFKAGQWLDLHIPDSNEIGGYSMCSCPSLFKRSGQFNLAVKLSSHPAATWMINECSVGMEVSYRFGGEVFLNEDNGTVKNNGFLLIAGGIGINPLYSILQTAVPTTKHPVRLLYSTQSQKDLVFLSEIESLAKDHNNLVGRYFVTGEDEGDGSASNSSMVFGRRMNELDLSTALEQLDLNSLRVYICGPNNMMNSISNDLKRLGVHDADIQYEMWW